MRRSLARAWICRLGFDSTGLGCIVTLLVIGGRQGLIMKTRRTNRLASRRPSAGRWLLLAISLPCAAARGQTTTRPAEAPVPAADRALERRLTRELGGRFKAYRTPHFSILSDADGRHVAGLKDTAEKTLADVVALVERLDIRRLSPSSKMTVVFFDDWKHYAGRAKAAGFHVDQAVPGFFSDRDNRCLVFNFANAELLQAKRRDVIVASLELSAEEGRAAPGDESVRRRLDAKRRRIRELEGLILAIERQITRTVVRHEIAHQVLFNLGLQPRTAAPLRWLREGLAMQFETSGAVNRHRLEDFLAVANGRDRLELPALVGDPKHIGPGAANLPARYATAWALVAFVIEQQPKQFATYVEEQGRTTSAPSDSRAAVSRFEASFGELDADFEKALTEWAKRLHHRPER